MHHGRLLGARLDGGDPAARLREMVARRARRTIRNALIGMTTHKPYDKLAIVAFAVNRDWRSPDVWFCDELVAAGLEHAEVVRKLAPCLNRLDVCDCIWS